MANRHATLTPSVIRHLTTLPELTEQFPFLRYAARAMKTKEKRSCCGGGRRSGTAPAQVYETVKASMAHLPADRMVIIKKALNVDKITITYGVNGKESVYNR